MIKKVITRKQKIVDDNLKSNKSNENYQEVRYIKVATQFAGQRLDNHLMRILKNLPRNKLYKIIRKGEVRVNKKRVKPEYNIQPDDLIRIPPLILENRNSVNSPVKAQQQIEEAIIHEDKNIIVINKPSGMAVHGGSGLSFGVIEAIRNSRPKAKYLELVHRLDRDTSGCLLIAKKPSVLKSLHAQFTQLGGISKKYYALVAGLWPSDLDIIEEPLLKNTLKSGERIVVLSKEGKHATTKYKIVEQVAELTLLEVSPITGRTHQIRVHCQFAGYPIIGDSKYNSVDSKKLTKKLACKRLCLHAKSLEFHDTEGNKLIFTAPLPENLADVLQAANFNSF